MKRFLRYLILIGLALFIFVLFSIDISQVIAILKATSLNFLLLGVFLIPMEAVLKTWKLQVAVNTHDPYSFKDSLLTYLVGLPFGAVTPGKLGDFAKIFTLRKRTGLRMITGFSILVVDRFIELMALLFLVLVGLFVIRAKTGLTILIPLIVLVLMGLALFILLSEEYTKRLARLVYKIIIPQRYHDRLKSSFSSFYAGISKIVRDHGSFLGMIMISLLGWLTISTRVYFYSRSLGMHIDYFYFALSFPVVTFVELMPISIMGLGTREYALIILLGLLGIGREHAVSLSLMAFALGQVPLMIAGYGVALREHLSLSRVEMEESVSLGEGNDEPLG